MSTTPQEIDVLDADAFYGTTTEEPTKPTDEVETVMAVEDTAPVKVEPEPEEAETDEDQATENEGESEELYVELNGEEVSLSQIEEWKLGNLRQSDYTQKTQALADKTRGVEAEALALKESQQLLSDKLTLIESMISEDTLTDEEVKDMREYEPDNYIKYTEKLAARKELLNSSKKSAAPSVDVKQEQQRLVEIFPEWISEGKATDIYISDMNQLGDFYTKEGFTQENIDIVNSSALIAKSLVELARMKTKSGAIETTKKMVKKAPTITKPRARSASKPQVEDADLFYGTK